MALLDDGAWQGKVWTRLDGWRGGTYSAVEPATGETLGEVGRADPEDVTPRRSRAVEARSLGGAALRRAWPPSSRKAGDVLSANADEIKGWLARESGAIQPFGDFQVTNAAEQECRPRPAATRTASCCAPGRPAVLRPPVRRRGRRDRAVQRADDPRHPGGRPGAGPRQRQSPQARPADGDQRRRDVRPGLRGGRPARRRPPGAARRRRRRRGARGRARRPGHRLHRSTAAGRAVGALAGQHLKRAHLELGGNSALIVLPDVDVREAASVGAWGTFAHPGQICMATGAAPGAPDIAEEYTGDPHREGREPAGRRPVPGPRGARPADRRRSARPGPRPGDRQRSRAAPRLRTGGTYEGCSTGPPCWRTSRLTAPPTRRRSSARSRR